MLHTNRGKCYMLLNDELKAVGLTKTKLAEILNVSRQTVQRMGDDVNEEILTIIRNYLPKQGDRVKEPIDYTHDEIRALCKRRGGLEAETKPPKDGEVSPSWGKETDYEICQSIGIQVWEFNQMIARLVRH